MRHKGTILTALLCAAACLSGAAPPARGRQKGAPLARPLKFSDERVTLPLAFRRSAPDDPYLTRLRNEYALDAVVAGKAGDYERVRAVSRWVRTRWEHNGSNTPAKPDPISILEEAKQGRRFRCVEYSAVLAAALNSVGITPQHDDLTLVVLKVR